MTTEQKAALIAEALGQSPDHPGTARLARDLERVGSACPDCGADFECVLVPDPETHGRLFWAGDRCTNEECGRLGKGSYVDKRTAREMIVQDTESWRDTD